MFKYNGLNDWAATSMRARAWAVRDGDVLAACKECADLAGISVATVPEPSTLLLLFGLLPAILFTKKRKRSRQRFTS